MDYKTSPDGFFFWDYGVHYFPCFKYVAVSFRGQFIYAHSDAHLDYLEAFVKATVRVQKNKYTKSVFAKLPYFYRSPKYKQAVLQKLAILRKMLMEFRERRYILKKNINNKNKCVPGVFSN